MRGNAGPRDGWSRIDRAVDKAFVYVNENADRAFDYVGNNKQDVRRVAAVAKVAKEFGTGDAQRLGAATLGLAGMTLGAHGYLASEKPIEQRAAGHSFFEGMTTLPFSERTKEKVLKVADRGHDTLSAGHAYDRARKFAARSSSQRPAGSDRGRSRSQAQHTSYAARPSHSPVR
jgi:hypothetical protein